MLEIAIIWVCAKKIGDIVAAKGRKRVGYQLMFVALWIGGEIAGAIVGVILEVSSGGQTGRGFSCMGYICALVGAAVGAAIAFSVANSLTSIRSDDEFYAADDYDRGWRDRDLRPPAGWGQPVERPPGGDQITDRPAERRDDDRIRE